MTTFGGTLRACHRCGLVQRVGVVPRGYRARCPRCAATVRHARHPRSNARAASFALAALLLYPAALSLPVMQVQRLGHAHEATIWSGVVSLLAEGQTAIGLVVLFCSVVAPLAKLAATFALCAGDALLQRRHRATAYRLVEFLGRWGMVDVLLVAVLVAAVKLGDWVTVQAGPGVAAFGAVVVLSLLASASFDPHAVWEDDRR
ncbi:MAG: paraquat-inducible protein A [Phycisphaerales bacterium]|nr:paraquat-inducible protein A [Phycisphaerales bacterium]